MSEAKRRQPEKDPVEYSLEERSENLESVFNTAIDEGRAEFVDDIEVDGETYSGIRTHLDRTDVEDFYEANLDANFLHDAQKSPEETERVNEILAENSDGESRSMPENERLYTDEKRPIEQGMFSSSLPIFRDEFEIDGKIVDANMKFNKPVHAAVSEEYLAADTVEIYKTEDEDGKHIKVDGVNPWIGERFNAIDITYETEAADPETSREHNRNLMALTSDMVARTPLQDRAEDEDVEEYGTNETRNGHLLYEIDLETDADLSDPEVEVSAYPEAEESGPFMSFEPEVYSNGEEVGLEETYFDAN